MRIVHISDIHWRGIARHEEYNTAFNLLFEKIKALKPDLIINTGDTFHTKTQGITPEIIDRLSWMFRGLADMAPTYTLLGNHDGNLTNLHRQDIISPIHAAIQHPHAHLLRNSGVILLEDLARPKHPEDPDFYLCVYSPFDKKSWPSIRPVKSPDKKKKVVNIALFHGSVTGSETDTNWRMDEGETEITNFTDYDFALLGDIHKHQWISKRVDKDGNTKAWMAYPGSLIQQNFGESETKGFLVWDIASRDEWNVSFHELENRAPFITIPWKGSVAETIKKVLDERGKKAFLPGARFRVTSLQTIPPLEARKLVHELKEVRSASEVAFKYEQVSRMEHVTTDTLKISKKGLRQDPDTVVQLYRNYVTAHELNYNFDKEKLTEAENLIRGYMNKLSANDFETVASDINWSIKSFNFDNLFRYGEGNHVNFSNLEGIVGIFGPNRIGKSSIIGALMYTLFNTSDRGPLKNAHVINQRKNYGKGQVRFSVGGDDYIIERQSARVIPKRKPKKDDEQKSTTTLNLYKVEWDEERQCEKKISKNSVSRDETDKVIRKLIGSPNDFLLTALSGQGQVDSFIKEGSTERKHILSRFLELDIFKNLEELVKKDYNLLNARSNLMSAESLANQIKKVRKDISVIEQEIQLLDEKNQKLQMQKDEIKLWLMHHEKSAAEVDMTHLNEMEMAIETDQKTLEEKTLQLKKVKEQLVSNQRKLGIVKSSKRKIDIEELKTQLEDLEDVKSTLNELKHELTSQESKLASQKKNVRKLELVPCGDQYPQCYYIKDAHIDKKRIEKQESLVTTLTEQVTGHQEKLNEYVQKKIKETITTWQELDREEFNLITKLNGDRNHSDFLKNELVTLRQAIKKSKADFSALRKRVNILEGKEYESKKEQLEKLRSKIHELDSARQENLVNLGGKRERIAGLLLEQEESKSLIEKLKIYDSIQSAFSKTGIPAMVLKSQLPAINLELSKILTGITDFKISLETDINSNVMDVYIEDAHSRRVIELASGMEKFVASVALRVALINLSSLPKPDMLIVDEGFGALDEENVQSCMEMLTFLRSYFKTVLIISHVTQIKEIADRIIEVKHDGHDSFVDVP